jgi:drug/metabolite transporter (DMT)-like permease
MDRAHPDRERAIGLALVLVSACGFGSGGLLAPSVYATGLDVLVLLTWRFLIGVSLSWAWVLLRAETRAELRRVTRRDALVLLALGGVYVGNTATFYAALQTVPASLTTVITYLYPALVAVLSIRFARRLQGRRPWFALAIASLGVVLAVGGIDPRTTPPLHGLVLAFLSPAIYASWIILAARLGGERPAGEHVPPADPAAARRPIEPAVASTVMLSATGLAYLLASVLTGRFVPPAEVPQDAWPGLVGIGILATALAFQGFYAGARRIGAANASLVSTIEPVYTIVLATLLLGERLTAVQAVGAALVIAGVVLAQARGRRRATAPEGATGAASSGTQPRFPGPAPDASSDTTGT